MRNAKPSEPANSSSEHPASQIAAVAQIVRGMYIMRREAYDDLRFGLRSRQPPPRETYQRRDGAGSGSETVWDQIARVCLTHDIDPIEYVAAQFHDPDYVHPAPQPRQLTRRRAVAKWEEERPKMAELVRVTLQIDERYLRGKAGFHRHWYEMPIDQAYVFVLASSHENISALYRHCFATLFAIDDRFGRVANATLSEAALQYMSQRSIYRELLAHFLPPGFDERAFAIWAERFCQAGSATAGAAERPLAGRPTGFAW